MGIFKKQSKINKFFPKKSKPEDLNEEGHELVDEIQQLEEILKQKRRETIRLQRNIMRFDCQEFTQNPESPNKKDEIFIRPKQLRQEISYKKLKRDFELMVELTGVEVQSYKAGDHCVIVYHMQHHPTQTIKHGLRIDMRSGTNKISESSLPFGFNLNAVLDEFNDVMSPDCLEDIKNALAAYYSRLEQYDELRKMLNEDAQLIKNVDGTHIEVMFQARSELDEPGNEIPVILILDYGLHHIKPKQYSVVEIDIPEEAVASLKSQLGIFEKKCLKDAFKDVFIDGVGPYFIAKQFSVPREVQYRRRRQRRKQNPYNQNDETFRPEDCSQSEEEQDD